MKNSDVVVLSLLAAALGFFLGLGVGGADLPDRIDRKFVTAGFAYYTNSPSGYPVLVFREVKP